jgi:hypothetical protein
VLTNAVDCASDDVLIELIVEIIELTAVPEASGIKSKTLVPAPDGLWHSAHATELLPSAAKAPAAVYWATLRQGPGLVPEARRCLFRTNCVMHKSSSSAIGQKCRLAIRKRDSLPVVYRLLGRRGEIWRIRGIRMLIVSPTPQKRGLTVVADVSADAGW